MSVSDSEKDSKLIEIRAPMSGVFYRRSAPDQPPYVNEGDPVKKKQILGLLETMKVFQKIKAPVEGMIVRIVAENEQTMKDNDLILIMESV